MGAWNYGVFDDDTAYDALTDLKESSDIVADIDKYFDEVIQAKYVGYDEAEVEKYILDKISIHNKNITVNKFYSVEGLVNCEFDHSDGGYMNSEE